MHDYLKMVNIENAQFYTELASFLKELLDPGKIPETLKRMTLFALKAKRLRLDGKIIDATMRAALLMIDKITREIILRTDDEAVKDSCYYIRAVFQNHKIPEDELEILVNKIPALLSKISNKEDLDINLSMISIILNLAKDQIHYEISPVIQSLMKEYRDLSPTNIAWMCIVLESELQTRRIFIYPDQQVDPWFLELAPELIDQVNGDDFALRFIISYSTKVFSDSVYNHRLTIKFRDMILSNHGRVRELVHAISELISTIPLDQLEYVLFDLKLFDLSNSLMNTRYSWLQNTIKYKVEKFAKHLSQRLFPENNGL